MLTAVYGWNLAHLFTWTRNISTCYQRQL